jgi:hypothetical protein
MQTAVRPKPELHKVGERALSTHGFRQDIFEEHLYAHLGTANPWCSMSCAARTFTGRDTKKGRIGIRKRLSRAFNTFLEHGLFLAIEYAPRGSGHNGEALAVKLYQPAATDPKQLQHAIEQTERMRRRKLITDDNYAKARTILGLMADAQRDGQASS